MKKRIVTIFVALIMSVCLFYGCGGELKESIPLSYVYYGPNKYVDPDMASAVEEVKFNEKLFYRNDLKSAGADPAAIYVTEGEEKGYFYMYATSDEIGTCGYQCWRSKDLANWECRGVAFMPSRDSWALRDYWAPEVIYDEELKTYFMYYTATNFLTGVKGLGLATSKTPYGPFEQYVDEEKGIYLSTQLFDFTKMSADDPLAEKDGNRVRPMKVIDASPFKDEDGEKYMYFVHDLGGGGDCNGYSQSSIYVIKMIDWYTPDYTQVRKLTTPNIEQADGNKNDTGKPNPTAMSEGDVNEGPFMYKHNGKYYLTYSVNAYWQKAYSVRTAIGDSPMGPFRKLSREEGGWLLYAEAGGDNASGTGHHSFAKAGDELFIIYHAHRQRYSGGGQRAIAGDRVMFINNADGLEVPYANGPTYSLQPLAAEVSGYKNVISKAKVTADNTAEDSDVKYLTDGLIKYHSDGLVEEYKANGKSVIKINFENYVSTRAVMIYNSYDFDTALGYIDKIEFEFKKDNVFGKTYTKGLYYDWRSYCTIGNRMRAGGSFTVEYAEMLTKSITITINNGDLPFAIADIVVLGK